MAITVIATTDFSIIVSFLPSNVSTHLAVGSCPNAAGTESLDQGSRIMLQYGRVYVSVLNFLVKVIALYLFIKAACSWREMSYLYVEAFLLNQFWSFYLKGMPLK